MKEVANIYENFIALNKEKQERILNAACREFGRYGFKKTSMEQVAKNSGIAKGMVFHYFGSKLGLYEYLAEYTYNFFVEWFGDVNEKIKDFDYIEQYRYTTKVKLKAYTAQSCVFEFYTALFLNPENIEISEKIKLYYNKAIEMRIKTLDVIHSSHNTELFGNKFDEERSKKYITWMIEGYSQHILMAIGKAPLADVNLDSYWTEFDEMLDDMKKIFYVKYKQ